MNNIRIYRLANLLVNYSASVKSGERILIRGGTNTIPLIKEIYREVLKSGGYPEILLDVEGIQKIFFETANDEQLQSMSFLDSLVIDKFDAQISIMESFNKRELKNIDQSKITKYNRYRGKLYEKLMSKESEGSFRRCITQYPTDAVAKDAGMTLKECEDALFNGGLLDKTNPIEEWQKLSQNQQILVSYLNKVHNLHIIGNNVDLKMNIRDRRWISCDGKYNFPGGEIFTAPVEDSVEGFIEFEYPIFYGGNEINGIKLEFEQGKVVNARAKSGETILYSLLSADAGACRIGEMAIGTNYGVKEYPKNLFTNEKMGGTIHIALGASLPGTNGKNFSCVHVDIIKDMRQDSKIYGDHELFYENGAFKVGNND